MELRHLRYFEKVANYGSVSKAAAALTMTQPTLSRQILELEAELGHELFERSAKGVTLTAAGVGLFRHLEVIFAQLERIPEVLETSSHSKELVRVGIPQGLPHAWFLSLLAAVRAEMPDASISLHEATTYDQRRLLQNGLIDIAVLHMPPPDLDSVQVLSQRIGLAIPTDSPLLTRKELGFGDLAGLRIMAHATGAINIEEDRLRAESAKAGVETSWAFRKFSEHSSLIAVSSGVDGVLVTRATANRHLADWGWIPIRSMDDEGHVTEVRSWLSLTPSARPYLRRLVAVMVAAAKRLEVELDPS